MLKLLEKAEGKELQDQLLLPSVSLRPMSFNALVAPNEMFASALNRNLNLQRFKVLYICGNYSSILSRLDRRFQDLEIRRAFTVFSRVARCCQRGRRPALLTWNRYFSGGYDQKCRQSILLRRGAKSYDEAYFESLSRSAEEPDHPRGLDMIKLPWKREAKPLGPKIMVNPRILELQTAKQILEEIFHARPSDVEEMIQMRLEEKNWRKERRQEEEEPWPIEFCLGE